MSGLLPIHQQTVQHLGSQALKAENLLWFSDLQRVLQWSASRLFGPRRSRMNRGDRKNDPYIEWLSWWWFRRLSKTNWSLHYQSMLSMLEHVIEYVLCLLQRWGGLHNEQRESWRKRVRLRRKSSLDLRSKPAWGVSSWPHALKTNLSLEQGQIPNK